jgi:hypothetical protein
MDNPESRKKLYSAVSSKFDLGSFEEFESKVSPLKKKKNQFYRNCSRDKFISQRTGSFHWERNYARFPDIDTNEVNAKAFLR